MGLVGLAVLLALGYAAWRLFSEPDAEKRNATLKTLLGYAVTIALGFAAFRSGLPWLLGFVLLAYLLVRSGAIKKKVAEASARARSGASSRRMSREKALEVLGVSDGASEREINDRYKELMRRVHPDRGGSSYLATELNEAKRVLLGR